MAEVFPFMTAEERDAAARRDHLLKVVDKLRSDVERGVIVGFGYAGYGPNGVCTVAPPGPDAPLLLGAIVVLQKHLLDRLERTDAFEDITDEDDGA